MAKKVRVSMLVFLDRDSDGKKAEKLRAQLLKKSMRRKDAKGNTIVENEIDKDKGKPPMKLLVQP